MTWLDRSLYPELDEPPSALATVGDRIDFVARVCGAWDFGILPDLATIAELRKPEWRHAVDRCLMLTSHTYHLLREWHGLPKVEYLGSIPAFIRDDPSLEFV